MNKNNFYYKISETAKNFAFIITFVAKLYPSYFIAKIISILVNTINPFIFIIFPKFIIDAIVEGTGIDIVFKYIFIMCGCLLVTTSVNLYLDTYMNKYSGLLQFKIVRFVNEKIMDLNYEDLENPEILNLFEKGKSGFGIETIFSQFVSIASSILSLFGYITILLTFNWMMLIIVLLVVVINLFCNRMKHKYYYQMSEEAAPHNRRFGYIGTLLFDFSYAKEIKINNLSRFMLNKYDDIINSFKKIFTKVYNKLFIYTGMTSIASLLQTFFLYSIVGYAAVNKIISIGDFSMYISSISTVSGVMIGIVTNMLSISQSLKYTTDMRTFFELERKIDNGGLTEFDHSHVKIEFENVSFKYPGTDRYVLQNISFTVDHGEKISIVGKNGSGKTTLIKLILRLYEPTEGRILLNGRNISEYDYKEYLEMFAPILQDYKVFAFTLKENIVFDREYDEERLIRILEESGLGDKLKTLPDGVMTPIYKQFEENGVEFSGGENQKVAIARAIYKDSPVILLDEPTANLDPIAEFDIYSLIYNMLENKTSFFISHRLASCRFCNRIFMIDDGRLIGDGNHDELMQSCSLYNEMFTKQAEFYVKQ